MRVLEPHHLQVKKRRHSHKRWMVIVGALVGAGGLLLALNYAADAHILSRTNIKNAVSPVDTTEQPAHADSKIGTTPKTFTGNQFKDLYRQVYPTYPNTEEFAQPPDITGNAEADVRIRKIAESRGFKMMRIPVTALIKTDEPRLKGETDDLLQPRAFESWKEIKAAAKREGIPLSLMSAYRSPEWQRDLFMERLAAHGGSAEAIAAGTGDQALNATLDVTGVPGYSRHHTGYTVDFWCEDASGNFANSICFKWLSANNYLHAKEFGWIPSYPPGADEQGPEPEAWEYVWVGKSVLYQ